MHPPSPGVWAHAGVGIGLLARGSKAKSKRQGVLFDKLLEGGGGMRYTFFAKQLPQPVRLALDQGHQHLLPRLIVSRMQLDNLAMGYGIMMPQSPHMGGFAAGGNPQPPGGTSASVQLILNSWEYYLYCFTLWPLSEHGDQALDVTIPSKSGNFIRDNAGTLYHGAGTSEKPLFLRLLQGYLEHFLPHGGVVDSSGEILIEVIAQFWLSQNPTPAAAHLLTGWKFQPTSAAILNCLEAVVLHLNSHEVARLVAGRQSNSAHALLLPSMYHFFDTQLTQLPDISARVARLIRILVVYLQPWSQGKSSKIAASSSPATPTATPADPASPMTRASVGPPEAWEWKDFVQRNFFLYARLLTSVAKELCGAVCRFRMSEKRDLDMLRASAALFDTPRLLPLLRTMSQAAEQLLDHTLSPQSPYYEVLREQLMLLEGENGENGWRAACEAALPNQIYEWLAKMIDKLSLLSEEQRAKNPTSPVVQSIERLRASAQNAVQQLLPQGRELKRSAQPEKRSTTTLLLDGANRLTDEERRKLLNGGARCSALRVPFRATPRTTVRPVGRLEVGLLVEVAERIGKVEVGHLVGFAERMFPRLRISPHLPLQLLKLGFHPRLFASYDALALLVAHTALLILPSPEQLLLRLGWWLGFVVTFGLGVIVALRWSARCAANKPSLPASSLPSVAPPNRRLSTLTACACALAVCRHRPSAAAAAESWVPWIAEQLEKGVSEEEVWLIADRVRRGGWWGGGERRVIGGGGAWRGMGWGENGRGVTARDVLTWRPCGPSCGHIDSWACGACVVRRLRRRRAVDAHAFVALACGAWGVAARRPPSGVASMRQVKRSLKESLPEANKSGVGRAAELEQLLKMARPAPLPEGWAEQTDPASGSQYYHNELRRQSTWLRPM